MSVRLFHPEHTARRFAVVNLQPHVEGQVHVVVARGASRLSLTDHQLYGPFPLAEAELRQTEILAALRADGYVDGGLAALVTTIATSKSPKARARAAERLGWRRDVGGVAALVARAAYPKDDITAVITALGRIGDRSALPAVHAEAARKLLSRRRAGSEALRQLGDVDSLRIVADAAVARLPSSLQLAAATSSRIAYLVAFKALPFAEQGPALDALYELGSLEAVAAVREIVVDIDFTKPGMWRHVRSVLKRAMVRLDGDTAGILFHRLELRGRTAKGGTVATLKSGLDGETRATRVFSQRTAWWYAKASWRWLQRIARYRPEVYADVAAACLLPWRDADDVTAHGRTPASGHDFLLMRVVHNSVRFEVDRRRAIVKLRAKKTKPGTAVPGAGTREEAFASTWDASSAWPAVRRLLAHGQHRLVIAFAQRLLDAHPAILTDATVDELASMLRLGGAVGDRALALLQERLRGGFDLAVITALGGHEDDRIRALALHQVTDQAHRWTRDVDASLALLLGPPAVRDTATRLLLLTLPKAPTAVRAALVDKILPLIDVDLADDDGRFDGLAEVVDVLADQWRARLGIDDALRLIARNPVAVTVAALIVDVSAGAVAHLGVPLLLTLAAQPTAARRAVACAAIRVDAAMLRTQLGLLLELAEGEWDDVRAACVDVIAGLDAATLDIDALTAIVDSTWPAVQDAGKALIDRRLQNGDAPTELLSRLAQHPHRGLRRDVVDLATSTLRPGLVGLLRLEPMLRAVLFDVRPDATLRRDVFALLANRAMQDEAQAELVVNLCRELVRSRTHDVRDDALRCIAVIASRFPGVVDNDALIEVAA